MTNTRHIHLPVQPSYSAHPEVNRDDRPPSRPDASPQEGARGPRAGKAVPLRALPAGRRASTPHRPSTGPPLYGLDEVSRGGGSPEPPGERLSHMWCRRRVILRHHVCERTSLVALTLLLPYRGAQLVRPAVGHGGALRGAAPPGIAGSAAEPPPIPEKEPSPIAGLLQIPRSSIESVNTSRQLQRSPIAPLPVFDVASTSCDHNSLKTKDRSISAMKHRGEMTKNRRGLDWPRRLSDAARAH